MNLEQLPTQRNQNTKRHTYGPSMSSERMVAKILMEETKKTMIVSFKQDDEVIIVENWKQYNVDVSNPNTQIKPTKSSSGCLNICSIF